MNFPLFVAKRYFFSPKKRSFINVISLFSMIGVGMGISALIIVLSVFNGLEDLLRSLYASFDPDAKIVLVEGKTFDSAALPLETLRATKGVNTVTEVFEDNALLRYDNGEMVVRLKGVGGDYKFNEDFNNTIVEGTADLESNGERKAIIGRGVQYKLSVGIKNEFHPLQFLVPGRLKPGLTDPTKLLIKRSIMPGGVFAIEKQLDENYVIVPIDFSRDLFGKKLISSAVEIHFDEAADYDQVIGEIEAVVGEKFKVLDREKQHAEIYRLLNIEKVFVFGTFAFILLIASFNVFFTLSMLAIEKKDDLKIFNALGLSKNAVRRIFILEGVIISGFGALAGLALGLLICYLQQIFGFISMGMEAAIVDAYPVKIEWPDVLLSVIIIAIITYLASFRPAALASKIIQT